MSTNFYWPTFDNRFLMTIVNQSSTVAVVNLRSSFPSISISQPPWLIFDNHGRPTFADRFFYDFHQSTFVDSFSMIVIEQLWLPTFWWSLLANFHLLFFGERCRLTFIERFSVAIVGQLSSIIARWPLSTNFRQSFSVIFVTNFYWSFCDNNCWQLRTSIFWWMLLTNFCWICLMVIFDQVLSTIFNDLCHQLLPVILRK